MNSIQEIPPARTARQAFKTAHLLIICAMLPLFMCGQCTESDETPVTPQNPPAVPDTVELPVAYFEAWLGEWVGTINQNASSLIIPDSMNNLVNHLTVERATNSKNKMSFLIGGRIVFQVTPESETKATYSYVNVNLPRGNREVIATLAGDSLKFISAGIFFRNIGKFARE